MDAKYWGAYLSLARLMIKEGNAKDAKDLLTLLVSKAPPADVKGEAQALLDKMK